MASAALWSAIANLASKAEVLALTVVGARALTGSEFGALMSWIGFLYVGVVAADFGLTSYLQRQVAAMRIDVQHVASHAIVVAAVTLGPFLLLASIGAFLLDVFSSIGPWAACVLVAWILLALANGVFGAAYVGRLQFGRASVYPSVGRILAAGTIILSQVLGATTASLLSTTLMIGELIGVGVLIGRLPKQKRWRPVSIRRHGRELVPYFLNNLANSAYSRGDVPSVSLVAGNVAAGFYAPASQLQSLALTIPNILNAGTLAIVARSTGDMSALLRRTLWINVGASLVAVLCGIILAPTVLPIVFGPRFIDSVAICQLILLSVPFAAAHMVLGQTIIAQGHADFAARATFGALLFGLVSLFAMAAWFGPVGAAIAVVGRDITLLIIFIVIRRVMLTSRS